MPTRTAYEADEIFPVRGDGRILFRLVASRNVTESDWRSHYELGRLPYRAEISSALIHMGLSMWEGPEPLRELSARLPQLGTFIAAVELSGDRGIWFAANGPEGHFTVWGRRQDLQWAARLPAELV